jgi:hypothetical protein
MKCKRVKSLGRKVKFEGGGIAGIGQTVGSVMTGIARKKDGTVDPGINALGTAAQFAATAAPLGPIGALIAAPIGFFAGGLMAQKQNEEYERQKELERRATEMRQDIDSRAINDTYDEQGTNLNKRYYEYGGIQTQLASNVSKVDGPTHAEGGIDIGNIEVEDDEVAFETPAGTVWFSNKLKAMTGKTFAEEAEAIGELKGKAEKKAYDRYTKGAADRVIQIADQKLAALTQEQLAKQQELGINPTGTKAPFGFTPSVYANMNAIGAKLKRQENTASTINRIGEVLAPLADNITNAFLTANAPEIPAPIFQRPVVVEPNLDISAGLAENRRTAANTIEGIRKTSANSAQARANMLEATTKIVPANNQLYQAKLNADLQQRNINAQTINAVANSNIGRQTEFNTANYERAVNRSNQISANAANLQQDIGLRQVQDNQKRNDLMQMMLLAKRYETTGVYDRTIDDLYQRVLKGDEPIDKLFEEFNRITGNKKPINTKTLKG